jgi:alkylation response protein AidB-like acyl-CoA dehydrogenase
LELQVISFALTEEQGIARAAAASLAQTVLSPAARGADETAAIAPTTLSAAWTLGIIQTVADPDFATVEQPTVLNALLLEELASGDATVAAAIAAPLGFAKAIAEQGSERQRRELLPPFATNEPHFAAVAELNIAPDLGGTTPPGAGATRTGEGYELTGTVAMLPLAAHCRHLLVVAHCEGIDEALILPTDTPGVVIAPAPGTLGLRALNCADISFDRVKVPAAMRLGEAAGANIQRLRDASRIALCAMLSGLSRAVLDFALPYTKERIVHGEAIARKQSVAFKLADMHVAAAAMRWMGLKAAAELDDCPAAPRSARLAQLFAGDATMRIADEGLQIFGGHGFVRDLPLEMWYRNARSLSVLDGMVGA